jgi:hypothetical protein
MCAKVALTQDALAIRDDSDAHLTAGSGGFVCAYATTQLYQQLYQVRHLGLLRMYTPRRSASAAAAAGGRRQQ